MAVTQLKGNQILDGTVALVDMATLVANSIIGNNTGSSATPSALSVSQVQTMLGLATSSSDNAIVRFDGTSGGTQNSDIGISDAGKLGIGTLFPTSNLQVSPVVHSAGTASQSGGTVTGVGTTFTNTMYGDLLIFANGTTRTITGFTDATHITVTPTGTVGSQAYTINANGLNVDSQGNLYLGVQSTSQGSRMYIYGGSSGANIDVRGDANISDQAVIELEGSDYDSNPNSIYMYYGGPNAIGTTFGVTSVRTAAIVFNEASNALIGTTNTTPLRFYTNFTEVMRILSGGNVGIANTSPSEKLHVTGNILASGTILGSNLSGSNSGDQIITLTGNVTGTGTGSFATTIAAGVVTNAMLAGSIAASKLVGTDITTLGTIGTGTWAGTVIGQTHGGTGLTSLAQGDLIYGSAANTFSALTKNASATRYISNTGTSNNPAWAQVDLTNGVTGTLPVGSGGLGFGTTPTTGDMIYGLAGSWQIVAGNISTSKKFLTQTGNGSTSAAPVWNTLSLGDFPTINVATGGTNITSYAVGDILYASASTTLSKLADVATGNVLISGGVTTAPSWGKVGLTTHVSGNLPLANIANATANSKLLGSGASGSGASYAEITVGSGLTMTGTTLSASGGGVTIGNAVSGGGVNRVLYEDGSSNLATSASFTFGSSLLTSPNVHSSGALTVGANSSTGDFVQFSDTFDGSTVNTANWTATGTVTQSGSLSITGNSTWTGNGVVSTQSYRRSKSLVFTADFTPATGSNYGILGLSSITSLDYTSYAHGMAFQPGGSIAIFENGANPFITAAGVCTAGSPYRFKIVVTPTGAYYWVSADAGETYTLLYDGTGNSITTSPMYVMLIAYSSTQIFDNVCVDNGNDVLAGAKFIPANVNIGKKITSYNGLTTAAEGIVPIRQEAFVQSQTAQLFPAITHPGQAVGGTYDISCNLYIASGTTYSFSVLVQYNDQGNNAHFITIPLVLASGALATTATNVTGSGPYLGVKMRIRNAAGTSILVGTSGTFTSVNYDIECSIEQVA